MRADTAAETLRRTALRALAVFALEAAVLGSLVLRYARVADLDPRSRPGLGVAVFVAPVELDGV